jgi:hypothetical protein
MATTTTVTITITTDRCQEETSAAMAAEVRHSPSLAWVTPWNFALVLPAIRPASMHPVVLRNLKNQ